MVSLAIRRPETCCIAAWTWTSLSSSSSAAPSSPSSRSACFECTFAYSCSRDLNREWAQVFAYSCSRDLNREWVQVSSTRMRQRISSIWVFHSISSCSCCSRATAAARCRQRRWTRFAASARTPAQARCGGAADAAASLCKAFDAAAFDAAAFDVSLCKAAAFDAAAIGWKRGPGALPLAEAWRSSAETVLGDSSPRRSTPPPSPAPPPAPTPRCRTWW